MQWTDRLVGFAGESDLLACLHAFRDVNLERLLLLRRLLTVTRLALILLGDIRTAALTLHALGLHLLTNAQKANTEKEAQINEREGERERARVSNAIDAIEGSYSRLSINRRSVGRSVGRSVVGVSWSKREKEEWCVPDGED